MIEKIKLFVKRLVIKMEYNNCYSANEGYGAVFGMCSNCSDNNCPFHVTINLLDQKFTYAF